MSFFFLLAPRRSSSDLIFLTGGGVHMSPRSLAVFAPGDWIPLRTVPSNTSSVCLSFFHQQRSCQVNLYRISSSYEWPGALSDLPYLFSFFLSACIERTRRSAPYPFHSSCVSIGSIRNSAIEEIRNNSEFHHIIVDEMSVYSPRALLAT